MHQTANAWSASTGAEQRNAKRQRRPLQTRRERLPRVLKGKQVRSVFLKRCTYGYLQGVRAKQRRPASVPQVGWRENPTPMTSGQQMMRSQRQRRDPSRKRHQTPTG